MASGTFAFYGPFFKSVFNKEVDFDSDTIKVMLTNASYTPDVDTHQYKSSVTNEVTGTNWAAGGVTLANCTVSLDTANNRVRLIADDVSVASVTLSNAVTAVIYDATPASDATRPLIGYITFDSALSPNAGTLQIDFDNTNGFGRVTY